MLRTKNDLSEKTRSQMNDVLQARLADTIDLYQQSKQAHWNVKGPNFISLHELFDKAASATNEFMDLIAERIAQLGGTPEGTIRAASKRSTLAEYSLTLVNGKDHVEALSTTWAHYGKNVRQAIDQATELHDMDTADLFTEVSREADKYLWFLEAHLTN